MTRRTTSHTSKIEDFPNPFYSEPRGDYNEVLADLDPSKLDLEGFFREVGEVSRQKIKTAKHHKVRVTIDHATYNRLDNEFYNSVGHNRLEFRKDMEFNVIRNTDDWFIELQ